MLLSMESKTDVCNAHDAAGRHDQGRLFDFRRQRPQRLGDWRPLLQRLADQSHDWRPRDRHAVGRRRRRLEWRGRLAQRRRRRELEGRPSHQGNDGRLGRQGSQCRKDDRLDRGAVTVRRHVRANLVAQLRARHAVRGHQTGEPSGEHERRQGLGQGAWPDRSPVRRQLDSRRRRADAAHHPPRSG